jgi:DNA-binding NtrC family response regulator
MREAGPTRGAETVLLVEDEARIRDLCAKALTDGGYRVIEAASPEEALKLWNDKGASVELVISDVVMPGMTGHKLAEQLLSRAPRLRVILISGYAPVTESGPMSQRSVTFLQKPFAPEELLQRVRSALDSELETSSGVATTRDKDAGAS